MTNTNTLADIVRTRVSAMRKEAAASEAAQRSQARRAALTKTAGIATDYLATLPSQALASSGIPVVSQLAALTNMGGALGGLVADPEKEKNPKTDALSLVPGVGNFRLAQRSRRVMDESNRRGARGTANLVAEAVGPISSSILGAGAGGLLGGALGSLRRDAFGRRGTVPGAAVGAVAGGVLPILIGSIAAGIRRKRTLEEQAAADTKGRAVAKYLVPGLSQYDSFKRLGASSHLDDKSKKPQKKAAEAMDAAYVEGFCKAAEAMGIDPVALYKQAGPLDMIANIGGKVLGAFGKGGAIRNLGGRVVNSVHSRGVMGTGAEAARRAYRGVRSGAGRTWELLRGGNANVRGAFGMGEGDLTSMDKLKGYAQTYAEGLRGGMGADAASELRKVMGTRLAVGTLGTAGTVGGARALFGSGDAAPSAAV